MTYREAIFQSLREIGMLDAEIKEMVDNPPDDVALILDDEVTPGRESILLGLIHAELLACMVKKIAEN